MGQIWNRIRRIAQSYRYDQDHRYTLPEDDEDRKLKEIIDELTREQEKKAKENTRAQQDTQDRKEQRQTQQSGGMTIASATMVLGVQPSASSDEIKKAYKRLMMQYHPDRVAAEGQATAQKKAREINAAYEFLKKEKGF